MRRARVLGHAEPLDAHELKSATLQGNLSELTRPLETVVAQSAMARDPPAKLRISYLTKDHLLTDNGLVRGEF